MKSMYDRVLEEFLLQTKDKSQIRSFFSGAPMPAKTGYLKGYYKTGTTIVDGYYVEFNSRVLRLLGMQSKNIPGSRWRTRSIS